MNRNFTVGEPKIWGYIQQNISDERIIWGYEPQTSGFPEKFEGFLYGNP